MTKDLTPILGSLDFSSATFDQLLEATMQGQWIRKPQGKASAVFVHGILSSAETCWLNANGSYWPELLKNEPELERLGIYVFTYQTGIFSGSYRIGDVVDALKEHMRLDGVLKCNQLIFVCHSMGGIVVRKFIVERAAELIGAGKEIDLYLVASPSLGATYADWLSPIAQLFGHAQADALRFVRNNDWLEDLDKEFVNLKEGRTLKIKGKELIEDKFVILPKLFGRQVVEPFSGAKYFGEPFKVPASDHFSIAKPGDKNAMQHRLLRQFILDALSSGPKPPEPEPPPSVAPLPQTPQAAPPRSPTVSLRSGALAVWQERLEFLQVEEAKAVDPVAKFSLRKSIEEAKAKIREHGGHA
jgi:hypothetical protein